MVLAAAAMLLIPLQLGGPAGAQGGVPGTLDPTFDIDGIALNELVSGVSSVDDTALLPDGRVLLLVDGKVWRLFPDGTVDTGFDLDGVLSPASSDRFNGTRIALRPGGGFVLASGGGGFDQDCPAGWVAQFGADGAIVSTFGSNGAACINYPGFTGASDVVVQADDRIVVLGSYQPAGGSAQIALVRLSATGAVANTVTQSLNSTFESGEELAVQPNGDIVVAGSTNQFPDYSYINVVLSRYRADTLALDSGFGDDGVSVLSTTLNDSGSPVRLALRPDGLGMSVVLAGSNIIPDDTRVPMVQQLLADQNGNDAGVVEVDDMASVNDLVATATGFVATGTFQEDPAAVALGFGVTSPVATHFTHPGGTQAYSHSGGAVLLPDGKLLYASRLDAADGQQLLLNRLVENTSANPRTVTLDPTIGSSFGQAGFLTLTAATADRGHAVAPQPDGMVLVGGVSRTALGNRVGDAGSTVGDDGFVLRHKEDGSLDTTFGGPQRPGVRFLDFKVNGVAHAPDGRVVAAGSRSYNSDSGGGERGLVQRLRADGSPDPDWNDGNPTVVDPGTSTVPETWLRDLAVQPDNKVVAVGDYHPIQSCTEFGCTTQNWIVVTRFTADGGLDTGFGDEGVALIGPVPGSGQNVDVQFELSKGNGITLQSDGQIVVTGRLGSQLVVARVEADGDPDPTFAAPPGPFGPGVLADDLVVGTDSDRGLGRDIALHPDGRIVVAGDLTVQDCSNVVACFTRNLAIATRYQPDGTRDGGFGSGGMAQVTANSSEGHGVAVDGAGNVLVGGTATAPTTGSDLLLARLSPAGVPDTGFGTGGVVLTEVAQSDAGNALAIAADGQILMAGVNGNSRGDRVLTARFEPGSDLRCTPSPLDFGSSVIGNDAVDRAVTCTNTGPSRLTITEIASSGTNAAEFTPTTTGCVATILSPGESCQIPVEFSPTAVGDRQAALDVSHTGQGSAGPISVALTGVGVARDTTLRFDPAALTFAEQLGLTTSAAQTVTVTNTGTVPVTINGVGPENDATADFAVVASTCTGATLAPGASCQVSVTFTPHAPGARTASLRFDDSGLGSPHRVSLAGTGATPTLLVNPGLGRPGTVVVVTGTRFPPNQTVSLVWAESQTLLAGGFGEPGFSATSNPDGTLNATVMAFPKSRIGTRALVATVGAFTANAPFLVTPGTLQSPDLVYRR